MILQQECSEFSDTDKHYLAQALENIDKLVLLVRSLDSWPDVQNLEFSSFRISDLLQEIIEAMRPSLSETNMEVRERYRSECATTIGDRAKLRLALEDFLTAAARFATPDGVLDISAREKNGRIAIQLNADSGHPRSAPQPDLTAAARFWQLHGGRFSASHTDNSYSLTCELPLIDLLQQQLLLSRKD